MKHQVFISYRRADSALAAQFLHRELAGHFDQERIFFDKGIEPGADYVETLRAAAGNCELLIAVIGPDWLTVADESGHRRLDNEDDWVRLEIATALKRGVRVIPVTLRGAPPPSRTDLPGDIAKLADMQVLQLRDDDLEAGLSRLLAFVQKQLGMATPTGSEKDRKLADLLKNARLLKADADQMYLDSIAEAKAPEYGPDDTAQVDLGSMLDGFDEKAHLEKLRQAHKLMKQAAKLDPANTEVLLLMAELLIELTPDDPKDEQKLLYRVQTLIPDPKDDSERFRLAKATFLLAQSGEHVHSESLKDARAVFEQLGRREWVRQCDDILAGLSQPAQSETPQAAQQPQDFNPIGTWMIRDSAVYASQFQISFFPNGTFQGQQQTPALATQASLQGQWGFDPNNMALHIQGYANGMMPMGVSVFIQGQNPDGWYGTGNDGLAYMLSRVS